MPSWVLDRLQDELGGAEQILRHVATPRSSDIGEPPLTPEIRRLDVGFTMLRAVVLLNLAGLVDDQAGAGDEAAVVVEEIDLRRDRHAADHVQHPRHRLPS